MTVTTKKPHRFKVGDEIAFQPGKLAIFIVTAVLSRYRFVVELKT